MVFINQRYLNIHRIALTSLGLWPYQKLSISRIQTVFVFCAFFVLIFFQLTIFLTNKYDIEFFLRELTYIFPNIIYFLNYNCFYSNNEVIKQAIEHVKLDWKVIEERNELKILEKYTKLVYIGILLMDVLVIMGLFLFIIIECIPIILDVIIPLNESRPRHLKIPYEFFIDEEHYYPLYLITELVTVSVAIWSVIATNSFLLMIGGHSCGTLKIASYLIQNTVTENTLQIPVPHRIYFMYQNICRAVHIHRRTIQFLSNSLRSFHVWYIPLLIFGVISSSCVLLRILNAVIRLNDVSELFVSSVLFLGHFIFLFVASVGGQLLIDYSAEMVTSVYETLWYVAPLSIQKLLLLLLKSVKNFKVEIGGTFVLSLEGFSTIMTSTISYFTVLYKM